MYYSWRISGTDHRNLPLLLDRGVDDITATAHLAMHKNGHVNQVQELQAKQRLCMGTGTSTTGDGLRQQGHRHCNCRTSTVSCSVKPQAPGRLQYIYPAPESAGAPKKGPRDAKPLTPYTTSNSQAQRSHGGCHWERCVRELYHHEPSSGSVSNVQVSPVSSSTQLRRP